MNIHKGDGFIFREYAKPNVMEIGDIYIKNNCVHITFSFYKYMELEEPITKILHIPKNGTPFFYYNNKEYVLKERIWGDD